VLHLRFKKVTYFNDLVASAKMLRNKRVPAAVNIEKVPSEGTGHHTSLDVSCHSYTMLLCERGRYRVLLEDSYLVGREDV
jgi:hypothetical protein